MYKLKVVVTVHEKCFERARETGKENKLFSFRN
jgi:hypothetical protein